MGCGAAEAADLDFVVLSTLLCFFLPKVDIRLTSLTPIYFIEISFVSLPTLRCFLAVTRQRKLTPCHRSAIPQTSWTTETEDISATWHPGIKWRVQVLKTRVTMALTCQHTRLGGGVDEDGGNLTTGWESLQDILDIGAL